MVASDAEQDRVPEWYHKLQIEFGNKLRGKDLVGQAFSCVCKKGCDARRLQKDLFNLSRLPRRKVEKQYKSKDFLRLRNLAAKLEKIALELDGFQDLLFYESFASLNFQKEFLDWERPVEIPNTLRHLSDRLRQCSESARASRGGFPNAYQRIPAIAQYVREATGRPHYAELATLIGFAMRRPSFGTEEVKMICSRRKISAHKKVTLIS